MAIWHLKSKRKSTSGLVKKKRKKKAFERGSVFLDTKIGKKRTKVQRTLGGNTKAKVLSADSANVFDPKTKKMQKTKIISVEENKANLHYVRRNVITHGAVIKTDLGLARVTSRPGQHGAINAVLVEKK
ncbi:MAG: 30S ribosomal protein S8e [Nanoarchaeota archaeon]